MTTEKITPTPNEELPLIESIEDMTPEMLKELCNGCEEGECADECEQPIDSVDATITPPQ